MFTKIIISISAVLLLSACATHQEFVTNMNNWVGSDIEVFNKHIGQPNNTTKDCNDDITYVYNFQKQDGEVLKKCNIFVKVDKCTIQKISWEGNNCKAYPSALR